MIEVPLYRQSSTTLGDSRLTRIHGIQGYLAHKKRLTPGPYRRTMPNPKRVLGGGGSYERGTRVQHPMCPQLPYDDTNLQMRYKGTSLIRNTPP